MAMVLISAAPSEPPVCWVEFTRALATPASSWPTPSRAVLLIATNDRPMPRLTMTSAGSTVLT